jgi:hypothetical protein
MAKQRGVEDLDQRGTGAGKIIEVMTWIQCADHRTIGASQEANTIHS